MLLLMCSCGADMPDDMTNKVTTAENVAGDAHLCGSREFKRAFDCENITFIRCRQGRKASSNLR